MPHLFLSQKTKVFETTHQQKREARSVIALETLGREVPELLLSCWWVFQQG